MPNCFNRPIKGRSNLVQIQGTLVQIRGTSDMLG
jgi:hypothetical protein